MMEQDKVSVRQKKERRGGAVAFLIRMGAPETIRHLSLRGATASLLATKTGVIAVALAASATAGGVGLLVHSEGYTQMRGGSAVFASKSGALPNLPDGAHPEAYSGEEGGVSKSLDQFNEANQGAIATVGDDTELVEEADEASESVDSGVGVPDNNIALSGGASGAGAKRAQLKRTSSGFNPSSSKGGSGASFKAGQRNKSAAGRKLSAGASSGMRGSVRSKATSRRPTGARGGSKVASRQAVTTRGVTRGSLRGPNLSSQNSGATYDGGRGAQGTAGAGAGLPTAGGVGAAPEGISRKPNASTVQNLNSSTPAPRKVKKAKNKTPYQDLAKIAMLMMAIGALALFIANFAKEQGDSAATPQEQASYYEWAQIFGGIAMFAGGIAALIGLFILGQKGQMMQGLIYTVGGGIIAVAGAFIMTDNDKAKNAEAQAKSNAQNAYQNDPSIPDGMKNGTVESVDSDGLARVVNSDGELLGNYQLNQPGSPNYTPAPDTNVTGTWQGQ
jgi:hypothetical protein